MNFTRRCRVLLPPDKWREHEIHSDCSASCHAFFVPRVILVIYLQTLHFHFEQSLAHRQPLFLSTGQQNNKSAELYFRYLLGCALRWENTRISAGVSKMGSGPRVSQEE